MAPFESADRDRVGAVSQPLIPTGERSGLLTRVVMTENVRRVIIRSDLFVCGGLLPFTEPRYVFAYYMAPFYKRARSSEFWIEHANVGRKCCQKSAKICYSIVFECSLTHSFRRERASGSCGS